MVRIISRNALITTNTLLIHCTKTICLTYSLNGQFTNANGTKERIYPHSFSVYGEGERRSRILASFKSHILLVWCVNVLTVFVVMFGWPWGWMLVSKWFFHIPQESNRNNSNFLNLRFQTKKNLRFIYFFKFKNMWRFKLSILPTGFVKFQQFKFHISQYLIDSITATPSISLSKRISKYSNFNSHFHL